MQRLTRLRLHTIHRLPRTRLYSSSFQNRPGPPKLAASEQAEFERLQRAAAVSSAFQPQSADSASPAQSQTQEQAQSSTLTEEESVNPAYVRGAPPEFTGDKNPKTGEVGGPKNEPLRWGGQGDWSYNGRVTDF